MPGTVSAASCKKEGKMATITQLQGHLVGHLLAEESQLKENYLERTCTGVCTVEVCS